MDLELLHGHPDQPGYTKAVRVALRQQLREVHKPPLAEPDVSCPCGKTKPMHLMYRCFFCGLWWCRDCAKRHFR